MDLLFTQYYRLAWCGSKLLFRACKAAIGSRFVGSGGIHPPQTISVSDIFSNVFPSCAAFVLEEVQSIFYFNYLYLVKVPRLVATKYLKPAVHNHRKQRLTKLLAQLILSCAEEVHEKFTSRCREEKIAVVFAYYSEIWRSFTIKATAIIWPQRQKLHLYLNFAQRIIARFLVIQLFTMLTVHHSHKSNLQ